MVYQTAPDEGKRDGVPLAVETLQKRSEPGDIVRAHGLTWTRARYGVWSAIARVRGQRVLLTAKSAGPDIWSLLVRTLKTRQHVHQETCPTTADLLRRAARIVEPTRRVP